MATPLPKPQNRSPLRLALGKRWFILKRHAAWHMPGRSYAVARSQEPLEHVHVSHRTPLLRQLKGVDMWLQHNKVASLTVAADCIDGLILRPGETFSFWRLVGKPSERRGFKVGLVLQNGAIGQGVGGGLCQMTNLIYWMTLHTELTVSERWRHGFDVFPDENRTQPFASGATCSYNYIDLQVRNRTQSDYQLRLRLDDTHLHGEWRSSEEQLNRFRVLERGHAIRQQWWGGYSRHNQLYRERLHAQSGAVLGEEFITENHAILMYAPLLGGVSS
jgi:vancomycin resistance protein VanW